MLLLELIKNEFGKYWEFNIRGAFDPTDVDMLRKYIDNNI